MKVFASRLRRAMWLDPELFEEVEHDHGAGAQALLVVLLASLAGGVGNLLAMALLRGQDVAWSSLLVISAGFFVSWVAWSFITTAIGTSLLGGHSDMGEMQRALAFAAAPGLLMLVPGLGVMVGIPWSLVAMVIAVRQACDFTTARALATVLIGVAVLAIILVPAACVMASRL